MRRSSVVVDTSIALKWAINEYDSNTALALLASWVDQGIEIIAPALLAYEATNSLYRRVRRGDIPFEDAERGLKEVILTVINLDFAQDAILNVQAMKLAKRFNLPAAYDAHYLAMAESENCELWTADKRLWNSIQGKLDWVHWIGNFAPQESE